MVLPAVSSAGPPLLQRSRTPSAAVLLGFVGLAASAVSAFAQNTPTNTIRAGLIFGPTRVQPPPANRLGSGKMNWNRRAGEDFEQAENRRVSRWVQAIRLF